MNDDELDELHVLPQKPEACAKEYVRIKQKLREELELYTRQSLIDRCNALESRLKREHPEVWEALTSSRRNRAPVKERARRRPSHPDKPPKEKAEKTTDELPPKEDVFQLPKEEFSAMAIRSPAALLCFCKGSEHYGVLTLRFVVRILAPDTTATVVLSQLLFWKCRTERAPARKGLQKWLRKTHAGLAAETGLSIAQVRGALQRLQELGLCQRRRGCRTSLLEPCIDEIARRIWSVYRVYVQHLLQCGRGSLTAEGTKPW